MPSRSVIIRKVAGDDPMIIARRACYRVYSETGVVPIDVLRWNPSYSLASDCGSCMRSCSTLCRGGRCSCGPDPLESSREARMSELTGQTVEVITTPRALLVKLVDSVWPSHALWRAIEAKYVMAERLERPVMDLGCGDGNFAALVFKRLDVGVDLSHRLLLAAQHRSVYERVCQADGMRLPFRDGSFQTVFSNSVLEHLPFLADVVREIGRVLDKGGRLVFTVPTERFNSLLLFRAESYLRMRNSVLQHRHLLTVDEWRELLGNHGLRIVRTQEYLSPLATRLWDALDLTVTPHLPRVYPGLWLWRIVPRRLRRSLFVECFSRYLAEECEGIGASRLIVAERCN